MLKRIRKIKFINTFFRVILKGTHDTLNSFLDFMIARWPTSGEIECIYDGQSFKMYNECDDDNLINILYYNNLKYEEENDLKLFIKLAKHAKSIIDIGANTGGYSILSALSNPNAAIYAIEPYSPNYNRLNINLKLNNCTNVKPIQLALGENAGTIEFTVPEGNSISEVASVNGEFSKSMLPELKWKKEVVKLETVDNIKVNEKIARIDLIKCDVETYEMSVFRGMDEVLRVDKPTIIFECFLDPERQVFFNDILEKYHYYVYAILEEGIVHLNKGFERSTKGLNYLLSPVPPQNNFVNYKSIASNPEVIMLQSM